MQRKWSSIGILLLVCMAAMFGLNTGVNSKSYSPSKVVQVDDIIWGFDFISETELILTKKHTGLMYIDLANNVRKPFSVPSVAVNGQGGLMDVHFKNVKGTDYIYYTYSTSHKDMLTTALARAVWNKGSLGKIEILFNAKVKGGSGRHFGSRLLFKDDHIYMTIGDRGERDYAQDLSYHNGKILRLDLNGKAVKDNPFVNTKRALPEIWSYGHRNPQGIDLDPVTKEIYSCEFGPQGGDELNLIKPGVNYGWPVITYGREYWGPKIGTTHHPKMEQPVAYWVPSISPSGMAFYKGHRLPKWKNQVFLATLGTVELRRLELKNGEVVKQETLFQDLSERVRHVRTGPDGYLYFSTDEGRLYRVNP